MPLCLAPPTAMPHTFDEANGPKGVSMNPGIPPTKPTSGGHNGSWNTCLWNPGVQQAGVGSSLHYFDLNGMAAEPLCNAMKLCRTASMHASIGRLALTSGAVSTSCAIGAGTCVRGNTRPSPTTPPVKAAPCAHRHQHVAHSRRRRVNVCNKGHVTRASTRRRHPAP